MSVPEPGWTTIATVTRVVNADTIEVEVKRRFNVQLRNVDKPEPDEPKGEASKAKLEELLGETPFDKSEVVVFVPSNNPEKLMDFNSFERVVGDVYYKGKRVR